ncbi:9256_t:CDS:2 [Acaulospora colombiana]|uniref:9256_t:CDS:1 n=1 Tax=Acaulospora colombiana TaxID=27376 RepID=A0ACA9L646_9GLOM|nr:9256_t:CDS:2 [Acaulospora colombiana]
MTAIHVADHTNSHALNATHEVNYISSHKYYVSSDSTCPASKLLTMISSWLDEAIEEAETRSLSPLTINNDIRDVNPEAK